MENISSATADLFLTFCTFYPCFLFVEGPAPVNVAEYEAYAAATLPRNAHGYYASGANDMITLRENRAAFSRLRIMPKILIDVSSIRYHLIPYQPLWTLSLILQQTSPFNSSLVQPIHVSLIHLTILWPIPATLAISVETTILGDKVISPICIAPTAMQRMAHDHGECATAKVDNAFLLH